MDTDIEIIYKNRQKEIDDFLILLSEFDRMEKNVELASNFKTLFPKLKYSDMVNVLKSNFFLMLYNLIEYTISSLINRVFFEIEDCKLSYIDVNEAIRKSWAYAKFKIIKYDNHVNFNTIIKKNEEIIKFILDKQVISLDSKSVLPGGNLDGTAICDTFCRIGVSIDTNNEFYRPDILQSIKRTRNNLAHGENSFGEALRDKTINDLQKEKEIIFAFLDQLFNKINDYLEQESYKYCKH